MKKKQAESNPRHRRTHLELAQAGRRIDKPGFSGAHLRAIKRISNMAQVPINRVFTDVIEIGIAAVMSNYKPMIELEMQRRDRAARIVTLLKGHELTYKHPSGLDIGDNSTYETRTSEAVGSGSAEEPDEVVNVVEYVTGRNSEPHTGVALDFSEATLSGPSDDVVGPGHEPETDEVAGGDDSESEVFIGR